LTGHPERQVAWDLLVDQFNAVNIQMILMSATIPPDLVGSFLKAFKMKRDEVMEVRSSTNRKEIGMHVIRVPSHPQGQAFQALKSLVNALSLRLQDDERMLVFFSSHQLVENFSKSVNCAVYHSGLVGDPGNSKNDNLRLWDSGKPKVMACTTAFAQGVDRSNVRYVVIYRPFYGLLTNNQMLGRAGRDGKESYVFFVTDQSPTVSSNSKQHTTPYVKELDDVIHGEFCRRYTNMLSMDGCWMATRCWEDSSSAQCDICRPESNMHQFALQAVKNDIQAHPPAAFQTASKHPEVSYRFVVSFTNFYINTKI